MTLFAGVLDNLILFLKESTSAVTGSTGKNIFLSIRSTGKSLHQIPCKNFLSVSQNSVVCRDFYSTKSICILCSWNAKIVPLAWTGLAHRNRKSAPSFSHSHAQVQTLLILLRSPSPSCNYHISYADWSLKARLMTWWNTDNYGMLYCIICHWNYFPFPMLQHLFNFASHFCLSYYSTSVRKKSRSILIAIQNWLYLTSTICCKTYLGFQNTVCQSI